MGRKKKERLKDVLVGVSGVIKIGTTEGSSFWFIGNADEFLGRMGEFNDAILERLDGSIGKAEECLKWEQEYRSKYIDIWDRIVTDIHSFVDDATIIMIEGCENGSLWLDNEVIGDGFAFAGFNHREIHFTNAEEGFV